MPPEAQTQNDQLQLGLEPEVAARRQPPAAERFETTPVQQPKRPVQAWPDLAEERRRVYQVHELNGAIGELFESNFRGIAVAGEISGCRQAGSGHYYFSLKDSLSQIRCVLFKGTARYARCRPREGLAVIARGSLEVYQARGEYQFIVEVLEPQGAGALQIAFEQLKKKLADEGLFAPERKRPLPPLPRRIGVITSPSGAVIRDILHVLGRRFQGLHVRLFPAQVQGEGAAEQVCAGLGFFSASAWADVVIVARGGGSLEDLWTFNEESVARAIAASRVPVISAVGHETDFTIADFVADHRAPTPSAAAEVVICTSQSLLDEVESCRSRIAGALRYRLLLAGRDLQRRGTERALRVIDRRLKSASQRCDELEDTLRRAQLDLLRHARRRWEAAHTRLQGSDLRLRFARLRHTNELLDRRLTKAAESTLWQAAARQRSLDLHLRQLSPLAVLERGYAIVAKPDGQIMRASKEAQAGDPLRVRLHRGQLDVNVSAALPDRDGASYTEG